jgi:hypothetical protein
VVILKEQRQIYKLHGQFCHLAYSVQHWGAASKQHGVGSESKWGVGVLLRGAEQPEQVMSKLVVKDCKVWILLYVCAL